MGCVLCGEGWWGVSCRVGSRPHVYVQNDSCVPQRRPRERFERTLVNVFNAHTQNKHTTHITQLTQIKTPQTSRSAHKTTPQVTAHSINTRRYPSTHKDPFSDTQHITRSRNGPSTRVPRVMLNTSFGSYVSCVCASFAAVGAVLQYLSTMLLQLDVRSQYPCGLWFASLSTILSSWCVVSESARRIGRRRVKWPRRRPRYPRERIRRCVYRWCMIRSWWICWLAKLSCGALRPVGRTPKQQCEDLLPDLWGGCQSEAESKKRLLAGHGELLRSVTSSLPARREEGVRDQQTQPQRDLQGKKNRRAKAQSRA